MPFCYVESVARADTATALARLTFFSTMCAPCFDATATQVRQTMLLI